MNDSHYDPVARKKAAGAVSDLREYSSFKKFRALPAAFATAVQQLFPALDVRINPVSRRAIPAQSAASVFDAFSTARSAPGATYYVDKATGSDSNPGTSGSPFLSIGKAIQTVNAGGVSATVYVRGSYSRQYGRTSGPYNAGLLQLITVDIAFIAWGGVVDVGAHDEAGYTWTADGSFPGRYTATVATASMVIDRRRKTSTRVGAVLDHLPDANTTKYQPGWYCDGTTLYLRRPDGAAPTVYNTRVMRPVPVFEVQADINVGFFSGDGISGWQMSGGANGDRNNTSTQAYGCIEYKITNPSQAAPASRKCLVAENCVFSHGHRGISVEGLHGLVYLDRCGGAEMLTDVYNFHCARTTVDYLAVLVGCWGRDTGIYPQTSNQILTGHDANRVKMLTFGCDFEGSRGGVVRNIGGSQWVSYFDRFGPDRGDDIDTAGAGAVQPSGVVLNDSGTTAWLYEPLFEGNLTDISVADAGTAAHVRSSRPVKSGGSGTSDDWTS